MRVLGRDDLRALRMRLTVCIGDDDDP